MPLVEVRIIILEIQISALFSCKLLKICIWLSLYKIQIKFEYSQFASNCLPLLELRKLGIVFHTFLIHAFTYRAEILHMTLFYWTADHVRVSSLSVGVMPLLGHRILLIQFYIQFYALFSYMLWYIERKFYIWLSLCRGHTWRVRLAKQETLTPPGHLVSPLVYRGPWMSTVVLYCWCHSDSASVVLYFTFLSHLFPLPCGACCTVPREGFDSSVIMPFSWCVVAVTLPI